MGFTMNCAIHDSSPRIWRRLMNFGLHPDFCCHNLIARTKDNKMCTVVEYGVILSVKEENLSDKVYDCNDNEDLFFALAALRDDTDIFQWFIYDNRDWNDKNPIRCWYLCKQDSIEDDLCYDQMYSDCEKATVEEIIAHFNNLDDDEIVINQQ